MFKKILKEAGIPIAIIAIGAILMIVGTQKSEMYHPEASEITKNIKKETLIEKKKREEKEEKELENQTKETSATPQEEIQTSKRKESLVVEAEKKESLVQEPIEAKEDTTVQETPVAETPAQEVPAAEEAVQEVPVTEIPVQETPAQPVQARTDGFNVNGYNFPIAPYYGEEGFIPVDQNIYLYQQNITPINIFLAEELAPSGEAARGMEVGTQIVVNGTQYVVTEVFRNLNANIGTSYANGQSEAGQTILERQDTHDLVVQTCERTYSGGRANLKLAFAKRQ